MHDGQIPTSKLISSALWAWTTLVLAAAWATWLANAHDLAVMLGFTACASSAVAATSSVRCYSLRVCGLLRAVADEPRGDLRSLR